MKPGKIIPEIYRHREQVARECGYDVKKLMNHSRQRESERDDKTTNWFHSLNLLARLDAFNSVL